MKKTHGAVIIKRYMGKFLVSILAGTLSVALMCLFPAVHRAPASERKIPDPGAAVETLIATPFYVIFETMQVMVVLADYAALRRTKAENPDLELSNVKIFYNSAKFEPSELTKSIMGWINVNSEDGVSEPENERIATACLAQYRVAYPNFNSRDFIDRKFKIKVKDGQALLLEKLRDAGVGGGASAELEISSGAGEGDTPEGGGSTVMVSFFRDADGSLPPARARFDIVNKKTGEILEKKVFILKRKKNDLWTAVKK